MRAAPGGDLRGAAVPFRYMWALAVIHFSLIKFVDFLKAAQYLFTGQLVTSINDDVITLAQAKGIVIGSVRPSERVSEKVLLRSTSNSDM